MTYKVNLEERKKFIDWFLARGLSESSIINYLFYYDRLGSSHTVTKIRANILLKKFKYNSVVRAFLKNYKEFIIDNKEDFNEEVLNNFNEIKIPKKKGAKPQKIPNFITEEEVWKIERALDRERDKLMLLLSFYCGIRLAGLMNIRPYSFNWVEWDSTREQGVKPIGKLKVAEKGSKERIVLVPYKVMERMDKWISEVAVKENPDKSKPLFKIGRQRWRDLLRTHSQKALNKHIHPHLLRHSFATHLLNKGIAIERVQKLMGHKDISSTQIYAHIVQKDIEEDYSKLVDF